MDKCPRSALSLYREKRQNEDTLFLIKIKIDYVFIFLLLL